MLVSIEHVTRYTRAAAVTYSVQSLRLTPPSFDAQQIVSWSIDMPHIDEAVRFRDSFGNMAHLVVLPEPLKEILIVARGTVQTHDRAGIARGMVEIAPARVYKRSTPRTAPDDAIRALAADTSATEPLERLHKLMEAVHEQVAYAIGTTSAATTASEAFKAGQGVCQDHAHIFIAAARILDLPARYVNGYFLVDSDSRAEAHHAWAEVWLTGLGWVGFDPANNMCPTDRYVRLACGLDSASAAPIRGTRRGGIDEVLDVTVEVQQQSAQQQ